MSEASSQVPAEEFKPLPADAPPARIKGRALRRSLHYTTLAWVFGAFWQASSGGAITTELANYLGANDFVQACLTAAILVGFLMQIPGSLLTQKLGRRKGIFITWVSIHRVLYILMGLLPWVLPAGRIGSAWLLVGVMLLSNCAANVGAQAWVNWMADLVPPRVRGKYFARRGRIGIVVLAATAIGVGLLLDASKTAAFAQWTAPLKAYTTLPPLIVMISAILVAAGILGTMDIQSFRWVDEPAMRPTPRHSLLRRVIVAYRDRAFRKYVTYASVIAFANGWMGWMWWVYFLDFCAQEQKTNPAHWWLPHRYLVGSLLLATGYNVGQFAGFPMWGAMIDRFGRKPVMFLSSTLHTISWCAWPFLSPGMLPWLLVTQLYGGLVGAGQDVANFNMMLDFNRKGGPGYQALAYVIINGTAAIAGVLAGALATQLGLILDGNPLRIVVGTWSIGFNHFALVAMMGICVKFFADFAVLPHVTDVEAKPTAHAMRFMAGNMYGNLNTLIFLPLRTLREWNPVTNQKLRPWNWGRDRGDEP
jgi:MFS family permease